MNRICCASALAVLILLSCTAPLYERAKVDNGLSVGGGLALCPVDYREGWSHEDYIERGATVFVRWGFAGDDALAFQGTTFGGNLSDFPAHIVGLEAHGYWKGGLWRNGAGMFGIGFPNFYTVGILQDIGDLFTVRVKGAYAGHDMHELDVAFGFHPQVAANIRGHISGCWATYVYQGWEDEVRGNGVSAGIGIEFLPGAR